MKQFQAISSNLQFISLCMHETTSRESPITSSADSKSLVPIDSKK